MIQESELLFYPKLYKAGLAMNVNEITCFYHNAVIKGRNYHLRTLTECTLKRLVRYACVMTVLLSTLLAVLI